jgi:hypothetical protein
LLELLELGLDPVPAPHVPRFPSTNAAAATTTAWGLHRRLREELGSRDPVGRARALRRKEDACACVGCAAERRSCVTGTDGGKVLFLAFEKVPCFVTTMDGRRFFFFLQWMWVWSNYT